MEESNVVYTGITQATSDLNCQDGDLSISHNIISQNGAMRPIVMPEPSFTMNEGERLVYVHATSEYTNYLYVKDDVLKAFTLINAGVRTDLSLSYNLGTDNINQIQSIGNTLIVFTGTAKVYLLYKENDYKVLGNDIPEVYIQFGLTGRTRMFSYSDESKSKFNVTFEDRIPWDGPAYHISYEILSDENQRTITEQVMAKINKFISEQVTEKGRFCFPFFVRYALRIYDGTLVKHSAPILMLPSTTITPVVLVSPKGNDGYATSADMDIMLVSASLNYRVLPTDGASSLKEDWRDIVKSIDIFISPPIYTYDTDGFCSAFGLGASIQYTSFVGRLVDYTNFREQSSNTKEEDSPYLPITGYSKSEDGTHSYPFKGKFLEYDFLDLYYLMYYPDRDGNFDILYLPQKNAEQLRESILNQSLFYFVNTIETDSLEWEQTNEIEIEEDYLENLTLKERMTDDWETHDQLFPTYSYVYNQRLNIANVERKLFDGFPALSMFCKKEADCRTEVLEGNELNIDPSYGICSFIDIYTYINEGHRDIIVKSSLSFENYSFPISTFLSYTTNGEEYVIVSKSTPSFFFYPNPNAYKIILVDSYGHKKELKLKEHNSLNGSYALIDFNSQILGNDIDVPIVTENNTIKELNKIYTSQVGNPFYFPLEGINTVGVGDIVGITSTTRALSQGQFGQFPLLVFATDGIWAMEVSDTGLYSVKQPISRDVCSNPQSITQTDGAVVFVSDKGVMVIDGSNVDLLSAELDGPSFDPLTVEKLNNVLDKEGLLEEVGSIQKAKDFFAACRIIYDYPNSRLIFYKEGSLYAYVYSIYSRTWATMTSDMVTAVSNYPDCYVQESDGNVLNISTKQDFDSDKIVKTLLLTRPMKLGDDALKTVNTVINRGVINRNEGAIVLYGSHDGLTYVPIGSSIGHRLSRLQGSPYRYFRLLLVRDMDIGQSLSATSVYFTRKWRNKPR